MPAFELAVIGTHISPAVGYGGVAESLYNLMQIWGRRGHTIRLCVSDGSDGEPVTVEKIGLPSSVSVGLYRAVIFKRWGFGFGAPFRILAACRDARIVYICGIATWPTTIAAIICALLRRPFIISPRGGLMSGHVAEIKTRKLHKWIFYRLVIFPTLRRARFIHVTSDLERDSVKRLLPDTRCETIINGIAIDDWNPAPAKTTGSLSILYAGRLESHKGIGRFARIWLSRHEKNEVLLIAGSGHGPYASRLLQLASHSDGAIQFLGYLTRSKMKAAYARSAFVVLPSGIEGDDVRENFGNVVAEAMAVGRPVLVTKGLAWDFVEECGLGFLFGTGDDEIAMAIAKARETFNKNYTSMCQRTRTFAEENLSLTAAADKLWQQFCETGPI